MKDGPAGKGGASASRRVLFVVTKLDLGGAIFVPLELARDLRARGVEVETWFLYLENPAYENEAGIRVLLAEKARGPLAYLRAFRRLIREMRRYRPDAVHGVLPLGNIFGLTVAWLLRCPIRVASQHYPADTQRPAMKLLDLVCGTTGIYTANIACSGFVRDTFDGYPAAYRKRLAVVQNGVPERAPHRERAAAREHFGLPADAWLAGSLGRLAYQKNLFFLIDVMKELPDITLVLAGRGEDEADLRNAIAQAGLSERILMPGAIPADQAPDFLACIDALVLPSRYEGLPIVLIEAMQAGLPMLASDIPSNREALVAPGQESAGMLLGIDSPGPWITGLKALYADEALCRKYAAAARARARTFTPERMAEGYRRFLLPEETRADAPEPGA